MAATKIFLSFLLVISFISSSSSLPTETLHEAVIILSTSGYLSMSLTIQLVSDSLIPLSPSLTIFSPCDAAFTESGQPSLFLLQLHFSPLAFPLNSLKSLSLGAKTPTLFPNSSLTITSTGDDVSLNGVEIKGPPIYDDGSLVIFGTDRFFYPGSGASGQIQGGSGNLGCSGKVSKGHYSFNEASWVLKLKGYSVMASFLDLQLLGFKDKTVLTIFAPVDEMMEGFVGKVTEYSSIFLRHVVPCKIMSSDLINFDDGVVLDAYLEGFGITVSKSSDILMVNEVPVSFPDMYQNDWLVVHGLQGMLEGPESAFRVAGTSSEIGSSDDYSFLDDDEF